MVAEAGGPGPRPPLPARFLNPRLMASSFSLSLSASQEQLQADAPGSGDDSRCQPSSPQHIPSAGAATSGNSCKAFPTHVPARARPGVLPSCSCQPGGMGPRMRFFPSLSSVVLLGNTHPASWGICPTSPSSSIWLREGEGGQVEALLSGACCRPHAVGTMVCIARRRKRSAHIESGRLSAPHDT